MSAQGLTLALEFVDSKAREIQDLHNVLTDRDSKLRLQGATEVLRQLRERLVRARGPLGE